MDSAQRRTSCASWLSAMEIPLSLDIQQGCGIVHEDSYCHALQRLAEMHEAQINRTKFSEVFDKERSSADQ